MKKIVNPDVKSKFQSYNPQVKKRLLELRSIIFKVAENTPEVGTLEETLKWGELAYVTSETNSGSTIRIDSKKSITPTFALYFNCKTTLVAEFRMEYGDLFKYQGNRSIIFALEEKIPVKQIKKCIKRALTYKLDNKNGNR